MTIAIPLSSKGTVPLHFKAAQKLALFDVSAEHDKIRKEAMIEPDMEGSCAWADMLRDEGVGLLFVHRIGKGALAAFEAKGIQVISGVPATTAENIIQEYLRGGILLQDTGCCGSRCRDKTSPKEQRLSSTRPEGTSRW